ncbi:DNA repair protein RecN [Legionella sp. W05-934-2]|uniref:DNA repair protein RecN n=1 Tax=Legionella sp. W05-934-2 TaxID=1198649 RepID=UPI003461E3A3
MLTALHIENFAIVKSLTLDFNDGMTAFTGETGAGKSIMIDALMLALGERADASVVRQGENICTITASFTFEPHSDPAIWLKDHDIIADEGEIILRRSIANEGRSKSYINGQPFPLNKIKELSSLLVDIHGQHQHQRLLQHPTHRQQLDDFANHPELLMKVNQHYKATRQLEQEIAHLRQLGTHEEKISLLQFQIDELSKLAVSEGEIETLDQEHQLLHHAKDYLQSSQLACQLLSSEEGNPDISSSLNQVLQQLQCLPESHPSIKSALELINNAMIQCDEAFSEIQQFVDQIDLDPERLYNVEARLSDIHQMARKYHIDPKELPSHLSSLMNQLDNLKNSETRLNALQIAFLEEQAKAQAACQALTESRKKHASNLAAEITAIIQKLGMPKGEVRVSITPLEKIQSHGFDKVEYLVCTNPGMPYDSLSKIASGGELSRISLAIQMITAEKGSTPTLLFDEVDVGIGGATAALVGKLLRQLGTRLQIFCVTHQPQVAASAHHHFLVEKTIEDSSTFSSITALSDHHRVEEIARMMGGLTITEQTRSHAEEMLFESIAEKTI